MMYVYDGNEYYLFHKDSVAGIYWDNRHQDLASSFRVDSLQRMATPYLTHFGLFKKGFGRLISTAIDDRTGSLKETYCDINFRKHPNADSCYVTYTDRFNALPRDMSLSHSLDSLYGKRLCEVRFVMRNAGAGVGTSAAAGVSGSAAARTAATAAASGSAPVRTFAAAGVPRSAAAEPGSGIFHRAEWSWKLEEIRDFDRATIQSYFSR